MSWHNVLSKTDRAMAAYLISEQAGTAADILPAKLSILKALPHTVCYSSSAVEAAPYSGTYRVNLAVSVKSLAVEELGDDPADQAKRVSSDAQVAFVFDLLKAGIDSSGATLAGNITTAARALAGSEPTKHADLADFTMQDILDKGIEASVDEDGVWIETMNLEAVVTPSNVS